MKQTAYEAATTGGTGKNYSPQGLGALTDIILETILTDTNRTPFGTPDDVAKAVKGRRNDLGKGGGFVQASVHNLQQEVPPENIVAMYETALGRR